MADRVDFYKYWDGYSSAPNNQSMMLNQNAHLLEDGDRADIVAALPDLSGRDVIELGAGIGRFTAAIAATARSVRATDFIESFVTKNRDLNGHLANVSFEVTDAAHLEAAEESCHLVFTNWLCMYLVDEEAVRFFSRVLRWLRPGGHLHVRESCTEPSSRKKGSQFDEVAANPTFYRHISQYIGALHKLRFVGNDGQCWRFELLWAKSVPTYIELVHNWRQMHLLARKVPADATTTPPSEQSVARVLGSETAVLQHKFDRQCAAAAVHLDGRPHPLAAVLLETVDAALGGRPVRRALVVDTGEAPAVSLDALAVAQKWQCGVTELVTGPLRLHTSLSAANDAADTRLQVFWSAKLATFTELLPFLRAVDVIIGCGYMTVQQWPALLSFSKQMAWAGCQLWWITPSHEGDELETLENVQSTVVTSKVVQELDLIFNHNQLSSTLVEDSAALALNAIRNVFCWRILHCSL